MKTKTSVRGAISVACIVIYILYFLIASQFIDITQFETLVVVILSGIGLLYFLSFLISGVIKFILKYQNRELELLQKHAYMNLQRNRKIDAKEMVGQKTYYGEHKYKGKSFVVWASGKSHRKKIFNSYLKDYVDQNFDEKDIEDKAFFININCYTNNIKKIKNGEK